MTVSESQPGALILGVEYQALGLLRQFHQAGIPCVLVDQDRWGPARFSWHRSRKFQCPPYETDEFWPWLVDLRVREGLNQWVLVPTDDEQVMQIATHHAEASKLFRYEGPDSGLYSMLYDKRESYLWCQEHGVPTPLSHLPLSREESSWGKLRFPFIVKPAFKKNFKKHSKAKAILVSSAEELKELLLGPLAEVDVRELIYQDVVPGDGRQQWSYAGLFKDGEPVAAFTACRRRQHPPDFGRASTYVIAEYDPEVERESLRVIRALRYSGLAEVEWKRDPRDGRLKFLEVNARSWGWQSLSSQVVGPVGVLLHRQLCGDKPSPVLPRYGARWVKHITDVPVVLDLWRRGELSLGDYVRSLTGRVTGCEWDVRDPLPFLLQFLLVPYLIRRRGY